MTPNPAPSPSPSPPPTGADIAVAVAAPPPRLYDDAYLSIFRFLDMRTLGAVAAAHRSLHAPLTRLTGPRITISTRQWRVAMQAGSSSSSGGSLPANSPLPSPRSPLRHLVDSLTASVYLSQLESVCAPASLADCMPQMTRLECYFRRQDAHQFLQKLLANEQAEESTKSEHDALASSASSASALSSSSAAPSAAASSAASPAASPSTPVFFFSLPPSLHTLRLGWSDVYGNGTIRTAVAVAQQMRALATLASRVPSLTDLTITGTSDVGASYTVVYDGEPSTFPPMIAELRALTKLERLKFELSNYKASEPSTRCLAKADLDTILLRLPSLTRLEFMHGRMSHSEFLHPLMHAGAADNKDDAYDECASAAASLRSRLRFLLFAPGWMPDVAELKASCPHLTNLI